jgi:peroxiredoxin
LRDQLARFEKVNAQLLAVDPHEHWSAKYLLKDSGFAADDVSYPLLADPTQTVSAAYGVAFQMRIHTEWSNRPATFIIDKSGVLQYARLGTSFGDRPKPSEILDELSKLAP